jgi:hypothetical protein
MVNPGHSSRGCWTCRKRRVKCDEARPTCLKCLKAKRLCLGYITPMQSKLRSEVQIHLQRETHSTSMANQLHIEHSALIGIHPILAYDAVDPGSYDFLGRLQSQWSLDQVTTLTRDVVAEGVHSLQSPLQSVQSRRSVHLRYGLALHHLRKALVSWQNAQVLFVPVLLFSLYEVNSLL